MLLNLVWIVCSLALLFTGAEALVRGSSSFALRVGLSPLVVGLTVVAFGTSSPELVVSVQAALAQQGDISLGNVVGSNSFNIGVILGITALICAIPVNQQIIRIDAPIALGASVLLLFLMLDQRLSRLEGMLLFAGLVGYNVWSIVASRRQQARVTGALLDPALPAKSARHWSLDMLLIGGGLGLLVWGSTLLVDNAVELATVLGVSEAVIGLTIIAAGTGMPELATSLVAALRRQPDIAIGNIVGSNIVNLLGILGVAAWVVPMNAPGVELTDYLVMILFSVILLLLLAWGQVLSRRDGALLLIIYAVYLYLLWPVSA